VPGRKAVSKAYTDSSGKAIEVADWARIRGSKTLKEGGPIDESGAFWGKPGAAFETLIKKAGRGLQDGSGLTNLLKFV
jgi:hypothetical protein